MPVKPIHIIRAGLVLAMTIGLAACGGSGASGYTGNSASGPVASSGGSSGGGGSTPPPASGWVWESGSTAADTPGTYTAQGVSSTGGPGGRFGDVQWREAAGNLWLWVFGGTGATTTSSTIGLLSDLWKYNTTTNQWTWVGGPDTLNGAGSYGTLGTAATSNLPPARTNAVSWTDASGNLWLFGGESNGPVWLNDLWEYTPSTNEWTWQGGPDTPDTPGVYGTEGVASTSNLPGPRSFDTAVTDSSGDVWIFGGCSYDGTISGDMNDLWMYNPATKAWTWEAGADAANQSGVYGTQGQPASGNTPGARQGAMMWVDASGNLWLFGGYGYDSTGAQGAMNDLWKFTPATRQWTWEGGSDLQNPSAVYGTQGTAAAANIPVGTFSGASWTDSSGNFWFFGGAGEYNNELNELWKYNPTTAEWTWEGGNPAVTAGAYGTEGVASTSNLPGARVEMSASVDSTGNTWIFGGYGYDASNNSGDLNDLWKLVP